MGFRMPSCSHTKPPVDGCRIYKNSLHCFTAQGRPQQLFNGKWALTIPAVNHHLVGTVADNCGGRELSVNFWDLLADLCERGPIDHESSCSGSVCVTTKAV